MYGYSHPARPFRPLLFRRPLIGPPGYQGLGQASPYIPTEAQIEKTSPKQGLFYRPQKAETVSSIARRAYGKDYTANGVKAIAASKWNHHILYTKRGPKNPYEYLKIVGPAMHALYSLNPISSYGSGDRFPVFWIPPLATKAEPEQVYPGNGDTGNGDTGMTDEEIAARIRRAVEDYMKVNPPPTGPTGKTGPPGTPGKAGQPGDQGKTGPAGRQGDAGPIGPPGSEGHISPELIAKKIADYIEAHPVAGVTPGQIAKAVKDYLEAHPPAGVPVGEIARQVGEWLEANPPAGVTPELIAREVAKYLKAHPVTGTPGAQGSQGEMGPVGPPGGPGPPGTASEEVIRRMIEAYLKTHPVEGGEPTPEQIAAAVRRYMELHPIDIPVGEGGEAWWEGWGVLAFLAKMSVAL